MIDTLKQNNFTLVLSGGGALGIAHVGLLKDLQKHSLIPSEIVGTSMGGIIGACRAIGLEYHEIFTILKEFSTITKWVKFSFSGNSIIDSSKIERIFENIFKEKKIKDTLIPLKLISTDLKSGEKKVFTKDDNIMIKDALLATMAIPGIFSEKKIGDKVYVDGFLCENLGLLEACHDVILAVDVLGKNSFETKLPDNFIKTKNVLDMFEKSLRLLIHNQTNLIKNSIDKKLFLVEPETKDFNTFSFHKVDEIFRVGENLL